MNTFQRILFIVLWLLSDGVWAQSTGIPCSTCPEFRRPPFPESGFWHNPLQPGSGFSLEVQNQTLAGTYFGYSSSGVPTWFTFNGELTRSIESGVAWAVNAQRFQLSGGNCLGCAYSAPEAEELDRISFEFLQRGLARFRIGTGEWSVIQTFVFGSEASPIGSAYVYPFPNLQGTWVLVFQDLGAQGDAASRRAYAANSVEGLGSADGSQRVFVFFESQNASESTILGDLKCVLTSDGSPACTYRAHPSLSRFPNSPTKEFVLPLGNVTDSRFKGEAADGETVEGFRISYD